MERWTDLRASDDVGRPQNSLTYPKNSWGFSHAQLSHQVPLRCVCSTHAPPKTQTNPMDSQYLQQRLQPSLPCCVLHVWREILWITCMKETCFYIPYPLYLHCQFMVFFKILAIVPSNVAVTLDLCGGHPYYFCCAFCSALLLPLHLQQKMIRHLMAVTCLWYLVHLALGGYEPESLVWDVFEQSIRGGPVFSPASVSLGFIAWFLIFLSVFWISSCHDGLWILFNNIYFLLAALNCSFVILLPPFFFFFSYCSRIFWPLRPTVQFKTHSAL